MSINDEIRSLHSARTMEVEARNALLQKVLSRLVHNHLRHRQPPSASSADDDRRILLIVSHMATRTPAAFAYGEPQAVGPTVLGLIELLAEPSEERQVAVVTALQQVLMLLRMASARALACLGREALALLASLPALEPPDGDVRAFESFATLCSTEDKELEPVALRLDSPARLAWARAGLFCFCARLHADCPQFLGDGGPTLWAAALANLAPPPLTPPPCRPAAGRGPSVLRLPAQVVPSPPPLLPALDALRALLTSFAAPLPLHSRLLHALLTLLTFSLPPDAAAAAATAAAAVEGSAAATDSAASPRPSVARSLPSFRSVELDTVIGQCVSALTRRSVPPLDALPQLTVAVPHALALSASSTLHVALCELLCTLPADVLDSLLGLLEPLLFSVRLRPALLPCFERALATMSTSTSPLDPPERPMRPPAAAAADDAGAHDAHVVEGPEGGGPEEGFAEEGRPAKRLRGSSASRPLRQRLFDSAMALEMGGLDMREDVRGSRDPTRYARVSRICRCPA